MAKTVLVVDDDPTQRRLIQAVLEREGFAVAHAENGDQAMKSRENSSRRSRHFSLAALRGPA